MALRFGHHPEAKGDLMWRLGLDTVGLGIVFVMLLSLLFAVLVLQQQRTGKTVAIWLAAGFVGVLLGSAATLGAWRWNTQQLLKVSATATASGAPGAAPAGSMGGMGAGMSSGMGGSGGTLAQETNATTRKIIRRNNLSFAPFINKNVSF